MPGGRNPYTRPANKPERAAMKRQSARKAAKDNIQSRVRENIEDVSQTLDQFKLDDGRLRTMKSLIDEAGSEDRKVLDNMKQKERRRKDDMFMMKKGGAVRGYMDGGEVCRGGGKAMRGTKFRGVK